MSTIFEKLRRNIQEKQVTVGIVGLGYVGIPLAYAISQVNIKVIGFDVDQERVQELNSGRSPIRSILPEQLENMIRAGFRATTDNAEIADCDVIIICVPTPLNIQREPDLSFVVATMDSILPNMRQGQMIALESTTWPGTTDEVLAPYFSRANLKIGEDAFLVYSPEREDPGNKNFSTNSIPKVIGGFTERCLEIGAALYGAFIKQVVPVSSTKAAELTKLVENIQRSVNIGLMNELKVLTQKMDVDIFEIVEAAATKPFGFTPYFPGPGIGGHCIPIDPFYLTWKAREFGLHTRFIELAGEINANMPDYVLSRLIAALNENGQSLNGARVLVLGLAYKPDVDDVRESPSIHVMERLRSWGAEVAYSDPYVPTFPKMREHSFDLSSEPLTDKNLAGFDAVVILTHHSEFNYDMVLKYSKIILDTRGVYKGTHLSKIYRA